MQALDSKRLVAKLAVLLYVALALFGCSGGDGVGGSMPFSATISGDGVGATARFFGPVGITTDGTNLYISDTDKQTIRKVVIATGATSTVAGSSGVAGASDGTGPAASFNFTYAMICYGANLFVTDVGNGALRWIVTTTDAVTTLPLGTPSIYPYGITSDGSNFYISEGNTIATEPGNTIRKIDISTGAMTVLAGSTLKGGSVDGSGTAALFLGPRGLATDQTYLYVADTGNNTVRKIEIASGVVTTLAGSAGSPGSSDGIGQAARFSAPLGLATDGVHLYVADKDNDTIRSIVIATGEVTTLAGTPRKSGSSDGIGSAALFNVPFGITILGSNLYVADTGNNTIRKIEIATGKVSTLAGLALR